MANSQTFTSLFTLADSHLSATKLQQSQSHTNGFTIPKLTSNNGSNSETYLIHPPDNTFIIPILNSRSSPNTNILSEQIANTLRARELKRQQELAEQEMLTKKLEEVEINNEADDYEIDLTQALQPLEDISPSLIIEEDAQSTGSVEELLNKNFFILEETEHVPSRAVEVLQQCKLDVEKLLKTKLHKKKVSPFGRVLCARYRKIAAPYIRDKTDNVQVKRFDFSTKSPDDEILERQKRPTAYNTYKTIETHNSLHLLLSGGVNWSSITPDKCKSSVT